MQTSNPPRKKKSRTGLLIALTMLIFAIAAIVFSLRVEPDTIPIYEVVPSDAVYVIETSNLTDGWDEVSSSAQWNHLLSNAYFAYLNEDAMYIDSLIHENRMVGRLMKDRRLLVSAHMTARDDYDFLFVVDLKKAGQFSFLTDLIDEEVSLSDYDIGKRDYKGEEIIELTYHSDGDILYLGFRGNLLLASYNKGILERAITTGPEESLGNDTGFLLAQENIRQSRLFNFYFNYRMLDAFLGVFFRENEELAALAGEVMQFSGFEASLKGERARFEGLTILADSQSSYLSALAKVAPGKSRVEEILSERTAFFLSMTFGNYDDFLEQLMAELQKEDSAAYNDYTRNVNRLERLFGIDLEEDLFSWIGNEIAYVKLQPSADTREKDFVVALHAADIAEAQEGMDRITTKVKRRTPWQVENTEYKNHEIRYFKLKGFFRMFFGKLFEKLEEPYFTFIGDYVVFSNTPSTLIDMIDDHTSARTLERQEDFMNFRNDFSSKASVSIFLRSPKMYNHLLYYANRKSRQDLEKNRELFLSYSRIGIQLTGLERGFETLIIADHDPRAFVNEEWNAFETTAEDLFNREFELYEFKVRLTDQEKMQDGFVRRYFEDSTLMAEGLVLNGTLSGLWRTYYPTGNIRSAVTYDDGRALGVSYFYYDLKDAPKRAEVYFRNDQITDIYREFYKNGARKAMIDYKNGRPDGEAEFYYESGAVKLKGQYRRGDKTGRWKHYSETGELLERDVEYEIR